MNLQTRSSLGDLGRHNLGPAFEEVFVQNLVQYDGRDVANQVFAFLNTDKSTFRTTGLTGFDLLEEFEEGEPIPKTVNIKTFETDWAVRDYGKSVTVTDDMLEDRERLNGALDEMKNHAISADTQEVRAAFQILNGGFATAAQVGGVSLHRYNNEALFLATHARADGGATQSNVSATNIALTELNLETGRLALVKQLTDIGLPIMSMGMITLAVPDDLEKNAVIFTASEQRPSSANNDMNFYRGRIGVVSSRWLNAEDNGSATAWFLIAKIGSNPSPLRVYRKGGPRFVASPPDSETWNQTMSVKNRFAAGNSEWKGTWASAGA